MTPYYTGPVPRPSLTQKFLARRSRRWLLGASTAMLAAALVATAVHGHAATAPSATTPASQIAALPSFAPLTEKVAPAVVTVATVLKANAPDAEEGAPFPSFPPGSPFEEFFRRFMDPNAPGSPMARPRGPVRGLGSGFIIDPTGYIATNNHVVGGADKITVILHDGTQLEATLAGRDPKTDLALLKIEYDKPLPTVSFGNSDTARVGDWVVAVGNPFGLGGTVTTGVVSARGRSIGSGSFDDYIQIDAPINRGNSGGPTFNLQGEVIGVNTAIYSPNGGSVGIGFAIPANIAKPVLEQLKDKGKVVRAWLGVHVQEVTPDIAESLGLKSRGGALVASVVADSPAAKAGVKIGDVILSLDGRDVEKVQALPRAVAQSKIGDTHEITVWRDGKTVTLNATLAEMPDEPKIAALPPGGDGALGQAKLGLALAPLNDETRAHFGIGLEVKGVVVTDVKLDSPAAEKGLEPGDVIVRVGSEPATSPAKVVEKVAEAEKAKRPAVLLLVNRRGNDRYVAVPLPRA